MPAVFASTYGDLAINDYMCAMLADTPALISPVKFHNSVHNAAAGYWSIGVASYAAYTAISAFDYTFATGLLEAITQVTCGNQQVLYVAFDIEAKGPLATMARSRGLLGVALVLGPHADGRTKRDLEVEVVSEVAVQPSPAGSAAAALVSQNAMAPCLPLFEALASPQQRGVTLALGRRTALQVQVK